MTERTIYILKLALRLKTDIWFSDSQLETLIEHLKSQGVVIGESEG